MQNLINGAIVGGSIVGAVAIFKAVDWLIGLKYKTKDACELCRKEMEDREQNNHDLLISLNTKVDLLLNGKNFKLED